MRHESHWDSIRGKGQTKGEHISNFFFTEIPDSCGAKEMFDMVKDFRLVVEVVIPPKRDKIFIKWKVENERGLAVKLDNILIKGKMIFANIPRFQRGRHVKQPSSRQEKDEAMKGRGGRF